MTPLPLDELTALEKVATPGPWGWHGNARNREVYLATKHSGRRYVMGFRRWGMSGAQPMFQPEERGLVPAEKLLAFEVGNQDVRGVEAAKADDSVYRLDIRDIDCADARLIAMAPELLRQTIAAARRGVEMEAEVARLREALADILKVRVNGWDNIWAGRDRCQDIARATLTGDAA